MLCMHLFLASVYSLKNLGHVYTGSYPNYTNTNNKYSVVEDRRNWYFAYFSGDVEATESVLSSLVVRFC